MDKIKMPKPIAELDGDEMTHVLWGMIKSELIEPFVELNTEYYDLSLPNRDKTEDAVQLAGCGHARGGRGDKAAARGRKMRDHHAEFAAAGGVRAQKAVALAQRDHSRRA